MNLLLVLVVIVSVWSTSFAIPLNMAKDKKGDEKPVVLNTDRTNHIEKRAKEVLMFGNQQNSPRIKKSDPETELLSTSAKSASSEGPIEVDLSEKLSPQSEEDRSSELLKVAKLIEKGEAARHDSDSDSDSDSDLEGENKSGSSDVDGDELGEDKGQLSAVQSIPVSLAVDEEGGDKVLAELNKVSLDKQTPLIINQAEVPSEKELPELGEQLETEKPADYDELLREYENENAAAIQRQQDLQSSPFLNYIYRRRREMEDRTQRTKRELLLPEDAEQYLKSEIPERLVTLESWPNAYSQSELLEKEAPYQIVNDAPKSDNAGYGYQSAGYGYQKRASERGGDVEEENTAEDDDDDEEDVAADADVPYEEVVLDGRPGYFIPAKRDFFPYSEEPVSHYSALVDKREAEEAEAEAEAEEADYARLLQLARALAVQHDGQENLPQE